MIVARLLGALLPLMATWSLAVVLQGLLWNLLADEQLGLSHWVVLAAATVPVVLLATAFASLGLLISLLFNSSGACGTVAALCWGCLALLVPSSAQLAAARLSVVPDPRAAQVRAQEASEQATAAYYRAHPAGAGGPDYYGQPMGARVASRKPYDDERQRARDLWRAQLHLAHQLSCISPVGALRGSLEEVAAQGFGGYETFERQAGRYQQEIRAFLLSFYPFGMDEPVTNAMGATVSARRVAAESSGSARPAASPLGAAGAGRPRPVTAAPVRRPCAPRCPCRRQPPERHGAEMTWTIARKEFLTSLLTYRFGVVLGRLHPPHGPGLPWTARCCVVTIAVGPACAL